MVGPCPGGRPSDSHRVLLEQSMMTWSAEILGQFLARSQQSKDRHHPLWHLLASTGMRRGETLGLRWSDVDLDRGCCPSSRLSSRSITRSNSERPRQRVVAELSTWIATPSPSFSSTALNNSNDVYCSGKGGAITTSSSTDRTAIRSTRNACPENLTEGSSDGASSESPCTDFAKGGRLSLSGQTFNPSSCKNDLATRRSASHWTPTAMSP